ncbi:flagellar motor switch protein FliN [Balneolales bacterium ANBcel1]|nr:flagellar motor switch protein FliN [Balneolales bacterium ANBcel1]
MNVENWKTELEKSLPEVEKFLTSVLQEDAKVHVVEAESFDKEGLAKTLEKSDIYVFAQDETSKNSVVLVLEKEWFGLLSSIMMGVEEKENNEITRDLLKKFSTELSVTLMKSLRKEGLKIALGDIEVLTLRQLEKKIKKGTFFYAKMDVEGLADDMVRSGLLLGIQSADEDSVEGGQEESVPSDGQVSNKESAAEAAEAPQPDQTGKKQPGASKTGQQGQPAGEQNAPGKEFTSIDTEQMGEESDSLVDEDQVVSGRKVEFDSFDEPVLEGTNGHSRSMALLKDVEMDVSVQLGQIEMPLGKVLKLAKGSIIELDKLAGEPVDILVNGSKIAQGEVVVIDEHFGVRISNLITTKDRIAKL